MATRADDRMLIGIIADRETTICFLIAGLREIETIHNEEESNYMIVDETIDDEQVKQGFLKMYKRKDICVIFIGADVANRINSTLASLTKIMPIILRIPSKSYLEHQDKLTEFAPLDRRELDEMLKRD